MEFIIIKIFLLAEKYSKYFSAIDTSFYKDNYREVYRLLLVLQTLQEKELKDYSIEDLELSFHTSYPVLKPDDRLLYDSIFSRLRETEVDDERITEYLEQQRKQAVAAKIASLSVDVALGKKGAETLNPLFEELNTEVEIEEVSPFVVDAKEHVYGEKKDGTYLYWRLNSLNKMLGPLSKGDFGFIFARPETGKTTMLASEVTYMAEQLHSAGITSPIIWFNNEEEGRKVLRRCHQAALGITKEEFEHNLDESLDMYGHQTGNLIKIVDDAGLSKRKVEAICKEYNPALIIFDQIDKIQGFEADRYDLMMKAIYQFARELAKKYGPVIGICQAGGTAEGKKRLNMNDVDSSHTAKQGEADFMFGIGKSNNDGEEYSRYISVCKNKLDGPGINEVMRHGHVAVTILPMTARYEDVHQWD